jgi:hypothetical protein
VHAARARASRRRAPRAAARRRVSVSTAVLRVFFKACVRVSGVCEVCARALASAHYGAAGTLRRTRNEAVHVSDVVCAHNGTSAT